MTEAGALHGLAQVNIARPKTPPDSPRLKDFVDHLGPVNADAEAADGSVWRLRSEEENATDIPALGDAWLPEATPLTPARGETPVDESRPGD